MIKEFIKNKSGDKYRITTVKTSSTSYYVDFVSLSGQLLTTGKRFDTREEAVKFIKS